MTTSIKCKNCENTKQYPGTTTISLQFIEANEKDDKSWCCNNCENELINKIKNQAKEIKELREYKLEKLKDEATKGIFDGVFSASTPSLARNNIDDLLKVHWQCLQKDVSAREQLEAKIRFCKNRLPISKADEVINQLLGEQLEIYELEKQLTNLQQV
jgi:hypothetical protein